jgi:hypothetical protein
MGWHCVGVGGMACLAWACKKTKRSSAIKINPLMSIKKTRNFFLLYVANPF